jgi:low affinity Fe/Cu permease
MSSEAKSLYASTERFSRFSRVSAIALGSPIAFALNCALILLWLISGPLFDYSDTWQLFVNTATTVFTYLAVFVIQNSQNRDAKAMHIKLDELIRSVKGARNRLVNLEELADAELNSLEQQFKELREKAMKQGQHKTTHGEGGRS